MASEPLKKEWFASFISLLIASRIGLVDFSPDFRVASWSVRLRERSGLAGMSPLAGKQLPPSTRADYSYLHLANPLLDGVCY